MMGKLTEQQRTSIPELRKQGRTMQEIADFLRVSIDTIVYHLYHEKYKKLYRDKRANERNTDPEKYRALKNDYFRRRVIGTVVEGKRVVIAGLLKRPHSSICEVCGKQPKKADYHHWCEEDPSTGMWLCQRCHWLANWLESPTFLESMEKYFILKEEINNGNK